MIYAEQLNLFTFTPGGTIEEDWTFQDAETRQYTHCYHDYPARMIPQIAARLIERYGTHARYLFAIITPSLIQFDFSSLRRFQGGSKSQEGVQARNFSKGVLQGGIVCQA